MMSVLTIDAGTTGVTALVVTSDGAVAARGFHEVTTQVPAPGRVEHAPEEIWRATLAATRDALAAYGGDDLGAVGLTSRRDTLVLWDRETLSSPRPAIGHQDGRAVDVAATLRAAGHEERVRELTGQPLDSCSAGPRLRWLAEHEPHTWALVEAGRYAVGTLDSYLVARMTRGTWHLTDVSHAGGTALLGLSTGDWSDELCGVFGVPRDALPDLAPTWGRIATTESRVFVGLALPISAIAAAEQATLAGRACLAEGEAALLDARPSDGLPAGDDAVVINTGPVPAPVRGGGGTGPRVTTAWRSPTGELTYALRGHVPTPAGTGSGQPGLGLPGLTVLRVDGGTDDLRCQSLADRAGVPVERGRGGDAAAWGAALLAGLGSGAWDCADALRGMWHPDRRFEPNG